MDSRAAKDWARSAEAASREAERETAFREMDGSVAGVLVSQCERSCFPVCSLIGLADILVVKSRVGKMKKNYMG